MIITSQMEKLWPERVMKQQETGPGWELVSWLRIPVFLANMLFTSPVALVMKPVSALPGQVCVERVFSRATISVTLTENHTQPHTKTFCFKKQIAWMHKTYMRRSWFYLINNGFVCMRWTQVYQEIWVAMGCWLTFVFVEAGVLIENSEARALCLLIGIRNQEPWTHEESSAACELNKLW